MAGMFSPDLNRRKNRTARWLKAVAWAFIAVCFSMALYGVLFLTWHLLFG